MPIAMNDGRIRRNEWYRQIFYDGSRAKKHIATASADRTVRVWKFNGICGR